MADYIKMIDKEQLVSISNDFDYLVATKNFIGLKFMPMVRTENMKLAVAQMSTYGGVPVMALIHALDSEAKIGDRPIVEGFNYELLYIKEKLNQGEALKKLLTTGLMNNDKTEMLRRIYDDAANLISRVLTRVEALVCEFISTAKLTINENNVAKVIDYQLPVTHRMTVQAWSNVATNILSDLAKIQKAAKGKIVRAIMTSKVMGYITANTNLATFAALTGDMVTEMWAKSYILAKLGIEIIVYDGDYRLSALEEASYYFLDEDTITFFTTREIIGQTFVTSTPAEDFGIVDGITGFVAVTQHMGNDPVALWTVAGAIALPCPFDIRQMYICTVEA